MSTDMQRYSIENQRDAMETYAAERGYTIVRNYTDAGKSGLHFRGRKGLKALIADVMGGQNEFGVILVYDVSRWGRFQDTDESAHYEFICRQQGISIEYCAEQFQNDGSLTATILKNIKRAMAGEYSRELSVKVFAGQSRIARNGFHVGSVPGYGLRRFLIGEDGILKGELRLGERKSIKSDRVILTPGPTDEVELVRYVYSSFIDGKSSLNAIARALNDQGALNASGRRWSSVSIRELLTNEKYAGACLYARTQKKLGINYRKNPPDQWVRKDGAFQPLVSSERFAKAQWQLRENVTFFTDNELLDFASAIWCKEGVLSRTVFDSLEIAPSATTLRKYFGSLGGLYKRIGYKRPAIANRMLNLDVCHQVRQRLIKEIYRQGGSAVPRVKSQMLINEHLKTTVSITRAAPSNVYSRWKLGSRSLSKPDILIVARIEDGTRSNIKDFYVLPLLFLPHGSWLMVAGLNYRRLEDFRVDNLNTFLKLCEWASLEAAKRDR